MLLEIGDRQFGAVAEGFEGDRCQPALFALEDFEFVVDRLLLAILSRPVDRTEQVKGILDADLERPSAHVRGDFGDIFVRVRVGGLLLESRMEAFDFVDRFQDDAAEGDELVLKGDITLLRVSTESREETSRFGVGRHGTVALTCLAGLGFCL